MSEPRVPRCMSTQHPDNVTVPFFAEDPQLGGEDEIQEAFYVFSHLGCDEQMWDCEGKEVDNYVVKKLLTKYESFFRERPLGQELFLTLRVPNPSVEKAEAKILLETLESIPRSFDAARIFYGQEIAPIFEVILPMTTSCRELNRIYHYYRNFVIGKKNRRLFPGDITIAEWIGDFKPKAINVIPLFEDWENLLQADRILKKYLRRKAIRYQRVFLARSDPAMNYGFLSAVFLNKIALYRLQKLEIQTGVKIFPILGVGSPPFRGHFRPDRVQEVVKDYPSVYTFTVQSAFKYDHPAEEVIQAVRFLRRRTPGLAPPIEEKKVLEIISRYTQAYQSQLRALAPAINKVARHCPRRRKRKLHIGLFGYARRHGEITLPRAIPFTAGLYSLGLPPELLGLNALKPADLDFLEEHYAHLKADLAEAWRFFYPDSPYVPPELKKALSRLEDRYGQEPEKEHQECVKGILSLLAEDRREEIDEYLLRAAAIRRFLG